MSNQTTAGVRTVVILAAMQAARDAQDIALRAYSAEINLNDVGAPARAAVHMTAANAAGALARTLTDELVKGL